MQQVLIVKCANGHEVISLCTRPDCQYPSSICQQQTCPYFNLHQKCLISCKVEQVDLILKQNANEYQQKEQKLILLTLHKMRKNIEIIEQDYLKTFDNFQTKFKGKTAELYKLLKKGPADQLLPKLVFEAISTLNQESKINQQNTIQRLSQMTEMLLKQQKIRLNKFRRFWKQPCFRFQEQQIDLQNISIYNDGLNLKHSKNWDTTFSLISPAISEFKNNSIRIRPLKISNFLYVGAANKKNMIQSMLGWTKDDTGLFLAASNGHLFNKKDTRNHRCNNGFIFKEGDVLKIQYFDDFKILSIENESQKIVFLVEIGENQDKDLCYCVSTGAVDDQWEIIDDVMEELL